MLSYQSSLQGHSDFHTPVTRPYWFHPACDGLTASGVSQERMDLRYYLFLSFVTCHWPYPRSLVGALTLFFPTSIGLLLGCKGSACIPLHSGFIPHPNSPSYYRSSLRSRGCTIRFMLRPATLACTPDWVQPAYSWRAFSVLCRGKFSPCVTTRTRPLPTHLKRAIDVTTSFQVARY